MNFFRQRINLHWIALKFKILMTTCPTPLYVWCTYDIFVHKLRDDTCTCTPLWVFSVRVRASPYGIFDRFADEWSLMGFSYRFVVSDAIWDFQCVWQRWTPFEFWESFPAFYHYVCVWLFEYLFIYLFIYSFTSIFIYLFICLSLCFNWLIDWLIDWFIIHLFTY